MAKLIEDKTIVYNRRFGKIGMFHKYAAPSCIVKTVDANNLIQLEKWGVKDTYIYFLQNNYIVVDNQGFETLVGSVAIIRSDIFSNYKIKIDNNVF